MGGGSPRPLLGSWIGIASPLRSSQLSVENGLY